MLIEIGMKGFKVASSDITNHPFLEFLAKKKLPILLSTGASSINEIKEAVREVLGYYESRVIVRNVQVLDDIDQNAWKIIITFLIKNF